MSRTADALQKTPLWSLHAARGGKMTPFAGYDMPLQYDGMGVLKEHLHVRAAAGLFDVSHMGQAALRGSAAAAVLESLTPGDIAGLAPGKMRYTVLLNAQGGIVDDLMVTRADAETLLLVVNAACREKDFALIAHAAAAAGLALERLPDRALLALQGPLAEKALARLLPAVAALKFMDWADCGGDIWASRSGYTGEDGFEISLPAARAESFAAELLEDDALRLIGLGARDSLRLEAGLCLYGSDIDEKTTPVEASLKWVVPKRRREEGNFPGAAKIMDQMRNGAPRLRVGIAAQDRAPLRAGTELLTPAGEKAGVVTSGGFGPTADAPVAMGYVDTALAAPGTALTALVRGTARPCAVCALPFVRHNYRKD